MPRHSRSDPTGFFFGSIFKAIGNFINSIFKAVVSLIKAVLKIPLLRSVIQIVACLNPISCVAAAGIMTAAMGGSISDIIQSMAMSAAQIGVWHAVGFVTTAIQGAMEVTRGVLNGAAVAFGIVKGAIHGVVGGAISLAQGGRFIDGFVANAVGAFAGVAGESIFGPAGGPGVEGRVALAAIAGGTAAELTGGKFANGAITAAFAQAFNGERKACILAGGGCEFEISNDPRVGRAPLFADDNFGAAVVAKNSANIIAAAAATGVDADLIRAIMYIENSHGYYDSIISWSGLNKSVLPMNINVSYWGNAFGSRAQLQNAAFNTMAGAKMLAAIQANLQPNASVAQIATLYNNLGATQVSNYGARVSAIYQHYHRKR